MEPKHATPAALAETEVDGASAILVEAIRRRYWIAEEKRSRWIRVWNDCCAYTPPS